jgi:hypothetical protein
VKQAEQLKGMDYLPTWEKNAIIGLAICDDTQSGARFLNRIEML